MNTDSVGHVSISFPIDDGEATYENMHAVRLDDGYMVDNSPFHAYGVSYMDIVSADLDKDGRLIFRNVVRRGGHSTYRIRMPEGKDHQTFLELWPKLQELGCSFEGSSLGCRRLYSVDLPPETNVDEVYDYLQMHEDRGDWEFEEAHYCAPEDYREVP